MAVCQDPEFFMAATLQSRSLLFAIVAVIAVAHGCGRATNLRPENRRAAVASLPFATSIEYPDLKTDFSNATTTDALPPRTIDDQTPTEHWDLSLEEAIHIALTNSKVLKELGGRIVAAPSGSMTVYDPAIRESDPLYGPEGALSAFDAQLSTNVFWSKNDRALNNILLGGGVRELQQDLGTGEMVLSKTAATGTQFSLRDLTTYDANNAPGNLFPSAWDNQLEATIRQPLLQGAGVEFNRIAGPNAQPGFYFSSGLLIARINTDISLAEFEAGVIEFVSAVEDAYWELYFAYHDLDSKLMTRNTALETWRDVHAKYTQGLPGAEAEKEAQAREQFIRLEEEVKASLNGAPNRVTGVYQGERQLRYLLGLSLNDGSLIRPCDEPPQARVSYDWQSVLGEALLRRPELRGQKWRIKRRDLELIAAKNFLLPRLDGVAQYRVRGFGDLLTGSGTAGRFSSALDDFASLDHQEWQLGMQLNMPLGFRRGMAAVRNAELQVARERALLAEQELKVAHVLGDAYAEAARAHDAIQLCGRRLSAAVENRHATHTAFKNDRLSVDLLLAAQERLSDAELRYYRSLTDYARAVKNVHLQKGSLLELNGVQLNEGPWPAKAHRDAAHLAKKLRPALVDYRIMRPARVSRGVVEQDWGTTDVAPKVETEVLPKAEPDAADAPSKALPIPPQPSASPPLSPPTT